MKQGTNLPLGMPRTLHLPDAPCLNTLASEACLNCPAIRRASVKRHLRFPLLPDLAYQVRSRLEGRPAGLPAGWRGLGALGFADKLERLDLPYGFLHVTAHGRSQNFIGLDDSVGVDQEATPCFHSTLFVVYTVGLADLSTRIRKHRERDATLDHLREFLVIPNLVNKHAVHTHRQDFHSKILEYRIFLGDRRDFGTSNKGEITWVEAEQHPFAQVFGDLDIDEFSFVISRRGKVRGFLSNQDHL